MCFTQWGYSYFKVPYSGCDISSSKIPDFFRKSKFRPKIWYSPFFLKSLTIHFVFFAFFRKEVSCTWVFFFLLFIVRFIFKVVFFDLSKSHLVQKNGLQVHSTTMWASSSHTKVSLEVFFSTSARLFPSENVIRNTFGKLKSHFFRGLIFLHPFIQLPILKFWKVLFRNFFVPLGMNVFFLVISRHIGSDTFFDLFCSLLENEQMSHPEHDSL